MYSVHICTINNNKSRDCTCNKQSFMFRSVGTSLSLSLSMLRNQCRLWMLRTGPTGPPTALHCNVGMHACLSCVRCVFVWVPLCACVRVCLLVYLPARVCVCVCVCVWLLKNGHHYIPPHPHPPPPPPSLQVQLCNFALSGGSILQWMRSGNHGWINRPWHSTLFNF